MDVVFVCAADGIEPGMRVVSDPPYRIYDYPSGQDGIYFVDYAVVLFEDDVTVKVKMCRESGGIDTRVCPAGSRHVGFLPQDSREGFLHLVLYTRGVLLYLPAAET